MDKNNRQTICRKIQIYPLGDADEINRVYKFIRDGTYNQYKGLNILMGQLASEFYKNNMDFKSEEFKKWQKDNISNNNHLFNDLEFAVGVDSKSLITQKVKQDFSTMIKHGLCKGERNISNYKRDFPLMTRNRNLKFTHNYDSHQEFLDNLTSPELSVNIDWVNKIKFKVIFGNPNKSQELRSVIKNILEEVYVVQGSSIELNGKKIILNLSLSIPKKGHILDDNTVVGVDLGIAIPAMCALNNNGYKRLKIGNKDDFFRVRTQLQAQRKRSQSGLKYASGGHGRGKKLQALDKFKKRESNFVQTYNHMVSKNVVDFAIKNNAKYINLEDLSGFDGNDIILRNWSYYQMQQYITYKAELNGIVVRKINPYHTSQTCSKCGHWEEGQRESQSQFKCKSCGFEANADFNAARNIAKSKEFTA